MARHLTIEDRDRIAELKHQGNKQNAIAQALQRSPSTICRELKRNSSDGKYLAGQAQQRADRRRRERPLLRSPRTPIVTKDGRPEDRRRIALIPFCQKFWNPGEGGSGPIELKINPNLSEELASEKEAILTWCVRGCLDWQKYGLLQPAVVREATSEYRTAEDVIAQWIASRCVESPEFELSARDAYEDYENWCSETSESHVTKQKFGARMKRRFKSRRSNGVWYSGVRIRLWTLIVS